MYTKIKKIVKDSEVEKQTNESNINEYITLNGPWKCINYSKKWKTLPHFERRNTEIHQPRHDPFKPWSILENRWYPQQFSQVKYTVSSLRSILASHLAVH